MRLRRRPQRRCGAIVEFDRRFTAHHMARNYLKLYTQLIRQRRHTFRDAAADLMGQAVRLGEALASLASRYPEGGVFDAMQRAARVGLAPRDLAALAADVERNAAEWSRLLGRDIPVDLKLDLDAPGNTAAVRFASELAETYRYLLQNAAIDADS